MKKILTIATLSIAIAVVIKRVTDHYIKLRAEHSEIFKEYKLLKDLKN